MASSNCWLARCHSGSGKRSIVLNLKTKAHDAVMLSVSLMAAFFELQHSSDVHFAGRTACAAHAAGEI